MMQLYRGHMGSEVKEESLVCGGVNRLVVDLVWPPQRDVFLYMVGKLVHHYCLFTHLYCGGVNDLRFLK